MKKIIKSIFVLMLSFSFSNASLVEDGYIELEKGNVLEAANIFKVSCEKGAFAGCYNLGLMYFKGEHIAKNYTKAEEYFSKACVQGHQNACYNLANMYEKGLDPHYLIDIHLAKYLPYFSVPRSTKIGFVVIGPDGKKIKSYLG